MLTHLTPMKALLGAACAVSVLIAAKSAEAVEVRLRSDEPGLHYTLVAIEGDWAAGCEGVCRLTPPEGQYWLWVSGKPGSGVRLSRRKVTLVDDSHLTVRPVYQTPFILGLVLGVTGPLVFFAPVVVSVARHGDSPHESDAAVGLSWAAVIGGAAMTATGWALFGSNLKPTVEFSATRSQQGSVLLTGHF